MDRLPATDVTASRREALAAGAGAVAGLLSGCTGASGLSVEVRQFDESDPLVTYNRIGKGSTELSYWTSRFYMPAQSGNNQPELSPLTGPFYRTLKQRSAQPAAAPALRAQHEEWARAHPAYRIDVTYPAPAQWRADLATRASQGDAPDGATIDSVWAPEFYEHLQPLNDYVEDVDDFFPFVRETAIRDGDLLAAWKYTGCGCLYYRQDLIDRYGDGSPPRTWEDVLGLGRDIADGEEITPFLFRGTAFDNLPYFWGQGGELVDEDGAPVLDRDGNRTALVNALSFLRDLVDTGVTSQRAADISSVEELSRRGRTDQVAMFVGNNDQIERSFKNRVDGDRWRRWRVAHIPMMEPDQFATGVGGFAEGAFREGDEGDAAATKAFVSKFVEPASMGRYCESAALLPTRKSLYDDDDLYSPDTPYHQQFRRFLDHGVARPAVPIYTTIADEYETAIEAVVTGRADPEQAVETMIANVTAEYEG
jgi:multiple sugar transport system substrate-binding protein